ncbi:unnamed protein product [Arabidopsis halleri]
MFCLYNQDSDQFICMLTKLLSLWICDIYRMRIMAKHLMEAKILIT